MAGLSPELRKSNEGMCNSYLEMPKEMTDALDLAERTERSRGVGNYSPESRLRRLTGVVDVGEALVHGRTKGGVRKVRRIIVKRKNKKEGVGASCVRGERPRRRCSSGGWQGWFWAAWGLRWGGDGCGMERGARGLSRQRRGRELMAL